MVTCDLCQVSYVVVLIPYVVILVLLMLMWT